MQRARESVRGPLRLYLLLAIAAAHACGDDDGTEAAPEDDGSVPADGSVDRDGSHLDSGAGVEAGALHDGGDVAGSDGGGGSTHTPGHDSGLQGDASQDAGPVPHPTSEYCGDAIRDPILEECDDGPGSQDDSCTADCRVRSAAVVEADDAGEADAGAGEAVERTLGTAPHVASAAEGGFAVVYQQLDVESGSSLWLQAFEPDGTRLVTPIDVGQGRAPTAAANPVVVALPDGRYAVAFTDGSTGTPDVALRLVDAESGAAATARTAHTSTAGFQQDPDMLWTGEELIVAWTDLLDIRYRRFDARLRPLASDRSLASSSAIESSVALATFGDGFAAAFRANEDGLEQIRVIAGGASWSTPPEPTGSIGDRPALVALDDGHLLLLFTVGTDPFGTGTASVGRLRASVLSIDAPGEVTAEPWAPRLEPYASDTTAAQGRPSTARVGGHVYVAWESAVPGSATGQTSQVFVAQLEFDAADDAIAADEELAMPLDVPHDGALSNPRLAASPLFPDGALLTVWEQTDAPGSDGTLLMLDLRPSPFVMLAPATP
jgi:cysteine-rich repeat protein